MSRCFSCSTRPRGCKQWALRASAQTSCYRALQRQAGPLVRPVSQHPEHHPGLQGGGASGFLTGGGLHTNCLPPQVCNPFSKTENSLLPEDTVWINEQAFNRHYLWEKSSSSTRGLPWSPIPAPLLMARRDHHLLCFTKGTRPNDLCPKLSHTWSH